MVLENLTRSISRWFVRYVERVQNIIVSSVAESLNRTKKKPICVGRAGIGYAPIVIAANLIVQRIEILGDEDETS